VKTSNNRHTLFFAINYVITSLYAISLPLYFYLDYPMLRAIYLSCGCYLAISLLLYIFFKKMMHLVLTAIVFILHALLAG